MPEHARTDSALARMKARAEGWTWFVLARDTVKDFFEDKAPRLGAALSYYTLFSIAPLFVISIALAGLVFGEEATRGQVVEALEGLMGAQGAEAIETMIANANRPGGSAVAATLGFVALLFGAGGVFIQLQDALDTVWEVREKRGRGWKGFLKDRFLSFGMVLGIGFLLLVSLIVTALINAAEGWIAARLGGGPALWRGVNFLVSLGLTTVLFALIFKLVPDAEVQWKDVWIGALATGVLFAVGKLLLGIYLGSSGLSSSYGAAGSLVLVLVWIYYSAQILLLGAEFTQVYATHRGSRIRPDEDAVALAEARSTRRGSGRPGA